MLTRMLRHLLPGACLLCELPLPPATEIDLCPHCLDSLPWNHSACWRCGAPLADFTADATEVPTVCTDCRDRPPPYARTLAPLRYEGPVQAWMHALKDRLGLVEGRLLAALMADAAESAYLDGATAATFEHLPARRPEALVPVPLTLFRLARRGHNQALTLALPVARRLGLPVWRHAVARQRAGRRQRRLGRAARLHNPTGAFRCRRRWPEAGPCLLVVDDVMTTGSTAAAVSRTLLDAGAAEVHVLCAARTPRYGC
jgi:ComF family protein